MYDGIARKISHYLFYGQTTSLCETCLALVPAKIVIEDDERLLSQALQRAWRAEDADVDRCRLLQALPRLPQAGRPALALQTRTEHGCPYDCGLCPDHEQHSCLALIDVNEACNLTCPVCFADSSPQRDRAPAAGRDRAHDGCAGGQRRRARSLQLSGGEPTIHPQILDDHRRGASAGRSATSCSTPTASASRRSRSSSRRWPSVQAGLRSLSAVRFARSATALKTLRGADLTPHSQAGAGSP